MSITISSITQALEPSATLAMSAKAKELKAAGKTVYDLSVGEPDFITPAHICQAAEAAMRAGHTKYTIASGIPELKKAVVEQYKARHGLEYTPSQVVVANGAKHALHNAFTVLLNPGDEVIIPAPYWVSYAELVKLTGATPVVVETSQESNFKLTPEMLRKAITGNTKLLPGNDASGRLMPTLVSTAVIAPASEPIISAKSPKNHAAEVGQNDTANSTPSSSAPHTPMASTRFCIPSDMVAPPRFVVIRPTRNIPRIRKIGPSTRCMYF